MVIGFSVVGAGPQSANAEMPIRRPEKKPPMPIGWLAVWLGCCCLAGCGGTRAGQLPTVKVAGLVTYRGVPLKSGRIRFVPLPIAGKQVRVAYGTVDAYGQYYMSTYAQGDGVVEGDYRVVVESREEPPPDDDVVKHRTKGGGVTVQQPKSLIPERYANPEASGLTAHVGPGRNAIDFDLKD
jgi:hypothetical protein